MQQTQMEAWDKSWEGIPFPTPTPCYWLFFFSSTETKTEEEFSISPYFLLIPLLLSAIFFSCASSHPPLLPNHILQALELMWQPTMVAILPMQYHHPKTIFNEDRFFCYSMRFPQVCTSNIRVNGDTSYVYVATGTRIITLLFKNG